MVAAGDRLGQASAPAVFGDFWRQAHRLALPPPYPDPPAGARQVRHVTVASLRAVMAMRRYLGDIAAAGAGVREGSWAHAIARARTATMLITGALRQETARTPVFGAGSLAARLDGYATALTYGRDLLHTHLATSPDGERRALSDWAAVIGSAPVNRALLAGLAEHARAIAGQLDRLPLAGNPDTQTIAAWQRLHGTAGQLRELDAAIQAAQWQAPVLPEHRRLLEAIPVNLAPAAQLPPPQATVRELCAGIIATAQRANQARRDLAGRAAWSPDLTADSMRHAAASYVVVSFNTETVYRALAERARQLGYPALAPGLDAAAGHAAGSRRGWLAVARIWDTMVTDTRGYLSRPAAEAGQLALWTGRLAYADPEWTPARRPSHAVRDPASMAPGPAALAEITSALHYAADSLARAARTEQDTVGAAGAAGRLYVTTRSLPELKYDVPRPYADAPRDRIAAALAAYADAAETCQAMLASAAQAAAAVGAPSLVLSLAEQATAHPATAPRGRLEQHLIDLGVRDARLLRQGAGLDHRAQQILAQAHRSGLAGPQPDAEATPAASAESHLAGEQPDPGMAEFHANGGAADAVTDRTVQGDATGAAETGKAARREPAIHEVQAGPPLEPSWQQGEAGRPAVAYHDEPRQPSRAERTAITCAQLAGKPPPARESPVTGQSAAAQWEAGQAARAGADRQARAEVAVQVCPAAAAEAARCGAAGHATTEAEADPSRPVPEQYLQNMAENQAGIDAAGDPAAQPAGREAGQRAQVGQELAMGEPEAQPEPGASWRQGEADRLAAAAAPEAGASPDAPEIGDREPELGL
jgi:hypothetical protein